MSEGIFPDEATIYIVNADVDGSSLASSDEVTGEVSNFSESGGEKDIETIPVFGGGNLDKESSRSQIEVSFDVELQYSPPNGNVSKWDEFKYGSGLTSATEGVSKAIYVQWSDGTNYYTRAYNNAKAVTWNPESGADGNLRGTITFKLSPTTSAAAANLQVVETAASTISW
jgi:hypothetical protein